MNALFKARGGGGFQGFKVLFKIADAAVSSTSLPAGARSESQNVDYAAAIFAVSGDLRSLRHRVETLLAHDDDNAVRRVVSLRRANRGLRSLNWPCVAQNWLISSKQDILESCCLLVG